MEKIPSTWNWRNEKRHLVAEISDGDTPLIVYKHWLRSKQRWAYKTEPKEIIEYELNLLARDKE